MDLRPVGCLMSAVMTLFERALIARQKARCRKLRYAGWTPAGIVQRRVRHGEVEVEAEAEAEGYLSLAKEPRLLCPGAMRSDVKRLRVLSVHLSAVAMPSQFLPPLMSRCRLCRTRTAGCLIPELPVHWSAM